MARKLNPSIVRMSYLKDLDTAQAQALARRLPMRVLAAALKGTPYAELFTAKLTGGMQERLRQELELTRAMNADTYKAERARLVDTMKQMIKEGFLTLKGAGAAPRPAGLPGAQPAGARPAAGSSAAPKPAGAAPSAAPKPAPAAAAPKH